MAARLNVTTGLICFLFIAIGVYSLTFFWEIDILYLTTSKLQLLSRTHLTDEEAPLSPFSPQCRLSMLHKKYNLTRVDEYGKNSCADLPIHFRPNNQTNFPSWAFIMEIGWRPEFDSCSLGVMIPSTDGLNKGAQDAIKSLLYFRTTPLTIYIIVDEKAANQYRDWFMKTKYPYIRVVMSPLEPVYKKISEPMLNQLTNKGPYLAAYLCGWFWALPGEEYMVMSANDMVHVTDPLELAKHFHEQDDKKQYYFGASRGYVFDWFYNGKFEGLVSPMVHSVKNMKRDEEYIWGVYHNVSHYMTRHKLTGSDMDTATYFKRMANEHVLPLGCSSFTDITNLCMVRNNYYVTHCDSVPRALHFKTKYVNMQSSFEDIKFLSMLSTALRHIPDSYLTFCPFQIGQEGPQWNWHHEVDPIKSEGLYQSSAKAATAKCMS